MFMATSMEPSAAPNAKSASARVAGALAIASRGRISARPSPTAMMIGLLP
jgi:hypothetical protein